MEMETDTENDNNMYWIKPRDWHRRYAVEPRPPSTELMPDLRRFQFKKIDSKVCFSNLVLIKRLSVEGRLAWLGGYPELSSMVQEIRQLVVQRDLAGQKYLSDWEVRGRLAEAEVAALHIEIDNLPNKFSKLNSEKNAYQSSLRNPHLEAKRKMYSEWVIWYDNNKNWSRGEVSRFIRELAKKEEYADIEIKTIERWHALWKKIETE